MSEFHIAENLLKLRNFHEYRQKDISQKLNISRQAYSNYERGLRLPDLETTLRLANFYRISLEQLLLSPTLSQVPANAAYRASGTSPVGTLSPMDGPETKMHRNYKLLPPEDQEDVREYIEFRVERHMRKKKGHV